MKPATPLDHPTITAVLFAPESCEYPEPDDNGTTIALPVADGILLHCLFYPVAQDSPLLLFFHDGRVPTAAALGRMAEACNRQGIGLFLASYRGYGKSGGQPGVGHLLGDATTLFDQALIWLRREGWLGPIFLMGHALGTIPTITIAGERGQEVKGLVLESALGSTLPYLQSLGVDVEALGLQESDGFNTLAVIQQIELPTLIFHGARDCLVTAAEAERLQAASGARNKQFYVIPGAERDNLAESAGQLYYETVKRFIDGVCGTNTWRQQRKKFISSQGGETG